MSGICSAHRHYERECPRCQTEKPAWVEALEAQVTALTAERDRYRETLAGLVAALPGEITRKEPMLSAWYEARELLKEETT